MPRSAEPSRAEVDSWGDNRGVLELAHLPHSPQTLRDVDEGAHADLVAARGTGEETEDAARQLAGSA